MSKVWLITGASRGMGRAYAETAAAKGDKVIAAVRKKDEKDPFYSNPNVYRVIMDVNKLEEIRAAVALGIEKFGRIDVLVNNAGYALYGALEEISEEELRAEFDTCFFGLVNVTKAVIPYMRKQRYGRIINISSRSGLIGEAGGTAYVAVKFAVSGLSEALHDELSEFGIQVMTVYPGGFRTDFRDVKSKKEAKTLMAKYDGKKARRPMEITRELNYKQPGDPEKAAQLIWEIANSEQMPAKLLLGKDCCDSIIHKLRNDLADIEAYYEISTKTILDSEIS